MSDHSVGSEIWVLKQDAALLRQQLVEKEKEIESVRIIWKKHCDELAANADKQIGELQQQLADAEDKIIDDFCGYLDKAGIDTSQWDGDTSPTDIVANGVIGLVGNLKEELADATKQLRERETDLENIARTYCGVELKAPMTHSDVACFVEGTINKLSDQLENATKLLATARDRVKELEKENRR